MIVKKITEYPRILQALGVDYDRGIIAVEDIVGLRIKAISNNDFYVKDGMRFSPKSSMSDLMELYYGEVGILLEISGIIRRRSKLSFPF